MITCKEDLIGTYILNDCGELREMYIKKALELGLSVNSACLTTNSDLIFTKSQSADFGMVDHAITIEYLERTYGTQREVTLMDLKPTKFVKVEESIFDLKEEFELGELYCKNLCASDDYTKLNTEVALFGCAAAGNVYRKVEVDWVESVIGLAPVGYGIDRSFSHRLGIAGSYNKEQALTLANAIIASLTEKPE